MQLGPLTYMISQLLFLFFSCGPCFIWRELCEQYLNERFVSWIFAKKKGKKNLSAMLFSFFFLFSFFRKFAMQNVRIFIVFLVTFCFCFYLCFSFLFSVLFVCLFICLLLLFFLIFSLAINKKKRKEKPKTGLRSEIKTKNPLSWVSKDLGLNLFREG